MPSIRWTSPDCSAQSIVRMNLFVFFCDVELQFYKGSAPKRKGSAPKTEKQTFLFEFSWWRYGWMLCGRNSLQNCWWNCQRPGERRQVIQKNVILCVHREICFGIYSRILLLFLISETFNHPSVHPSIHPCRPLIRAHFMCYKIISN